MEETMSNLRLFIDSHDKRHGSFPSPFAREQLPPFLIAYEAACREEGVILLRTHVGLENGRAFCLTMAPDAEAVRRAHQKVGLAFDDITEVETISPSDVLLGLARAAE
jgi:hypothetical protein